MIQLFMSQKHTRQGCSFKDINLQIERGVGFNRPSGKDELSYFGRQAFEANAINGNADQPTVRRSMQRQMSRVSEFKPPQDGSRQCCVAH
jgi:hypothetical protein